MEYKWPLKGLSMLLLAGFAGFGYGQDEPKIAEIVKLTVNGSGCDETNTEVIVTNSRPNGPIDYFQVTYDDFSVKRGPDENGKSRKFCNSAVLIKFDGGWQYSVLSVETDGYASIAEGATGIFQSLVEFRNGGESQSKLYKFPGPVDKDYKIEKKEQIFTKVWSSCKENIPINLKTVIAIRGTRAEESVLTVDRQSGLLKQIWAIKWKKCVDD